MTVENSTIDGNMAFGVDLDTPGRRRRRRRRHLHPGRYAEHLWAARSPTTRRSPPRSGPAPTSSGGGIATADTVVSVTRSTIENNTLISLSTQVRTTQGGAFSIVGGSLTITDSKFAGNAPAGSNEFDHPGVTVVLKDSTVGEKAPRDLHPGRQGIHAHRLIDHTTPAPTRSQV